MNATLSLTEDIVNKLEDRSKERGMKPQDLAIEILEDELYYSEEENRIFEKRTMEALERVENNPNCKIMSQEEFLKELESW